MKLGHLPEPHSQILFCNYLRRIRFNRRIASYYFRVLIVYRAFQFANKTSSYFYKLVCVGIATYFGSQTFVNIGGISATIPLTGVPLPFISFVDHQ